MENLQSFAAAREELLAAILRRLTADSRFLASWLTGSFGRGQTDEISDLDLNIVVATEFAEALCAKPWQSGGQTIPERLSLISHFGQPAIIFEAHHNAPTPGSSFTTVVYESGQIVDWILIPQTEAKRPFRSLPLFEKLPIVLQPLPEPETLPERAQKASHQVCFFWMMMAVLVKWMIRRDTLELNTWFKILTDVTEDVERLIAGQVWEYHSPEVVSLRLTTEEQKTAVYQLCQRMLLLMPKVVELGGYTPTNPMPAIESRLRLVGDSLL